MDRPDRKDYWLFDKINQKECFLHFKYEDNMEKYCDYLEEQLKAKTGMINCYEKIVNEQDEEINRYKSAFKSINEAVGL